MQCAVCLAAAGAGRENPFCITPLFQAPSALPSLQIKQLQYFISWWGVVMILTSDIWYYENTRSHHWHQMHSMNLYIIRRFCDVFAYSCPAQVSFMVKGWFFMVPGWFFMVPGWFLMVFHGSGWVFMVFHGYRLIFHGYRLIFHGFSWFRVGFHGFRLVFHGFW